MPRYPLRRLTLVATTAGALAGCSVNPIVQWKPTNDPPKGMNAALADAQALRQKFETGAEQHLGRKLMTNDLLFGLGVASFAAVAAKSHRDVLATTAGLGGSTYLYSTTGLQQSVLDAYQVGIGRVNCAAVIGRTLRVDPSIAEAQTNATTTLRTEIPKLAEAIAKAEWALLGTPGIESTYKTAALERVASARARLSQAETVSKDADALNERETGAAAKLTGTLYAIHQAVNEMVSKGVAEPKAVLDSLKSLVGIVGDFGKAVGGGAAPAASASAPAGNDKTSQGHGGTGGSGARATLAPAAPAVDLTNITKALVKLSEVQARVGLLADAVAQRAARQVAAVDANDLDKCVPDANKLSSLRLSKTAFNFTANKDEDQSESFTVQGGAAGYYARFATQPTFGVTLDAKDGRSGLFEVKVPKSTKGPHELSIVVEDSSSSRNQTTVTVKVAAAAAAPTKPAGEGDGGRAVDLPKALAAAKANGASISFGPTGAPSRVTVRDVTTDAAGSLVVVTCQPGDKPAQLAKADARTRLLALLRDAYGLPAEVAEAVRKAPARLVVASDGNCLK